MSNVSSFEGNYLLKNEIDVNNNKIILTYGGKNLTDIQKELIIKKASNFNLKEIEVVVEQGMALEDIDIKDKEVVKLREELYKINSILKEKQLQIDSISAIPFLGNALLDELRKFYPQIRSCTYAHSLQFNDTVNIPEKISFVIFLTDKKGITESDKEKVNEWVKTRLNERNVKVLFE